MSGRNRSGDYVSKEKSEANDIHSDETGKHSTQKAPANKSGHGKKGGRLPRGIWTALWMLLCALLLIWIWGLNHRIENLKDRIDRLTRIAVEQRARLEQLAQAKDSGQEASRRQENPQREGDGGQGMDPQDSGGQQEAAAANGRGIADTGGEEAAHKVYLTFDDGPSAYTQEILDILDRYDVKATFFVVGREGARAEEAMRKIVEAGHTLGIHSYTHDYAGIYESTEAFAADFERAQDYLYEVTGVESRIYRFPGGSSNTVSDTDMRELARYLDSQGVRFFDWNISSGDGGSFLIPVETLIENCTATIKDHSTCVVLMHDAAGKSTTREALPKIIETIQAMDDTVLLPITDETAVIQHIEWQDGD